MPTIIEIKIQYILREKKHLNYCRIIKIVHRRHHQIENGENIEICFYRKCAMSGRKKNSKKL